MHTDWIDYNQGKIFYYFTVNAERFMKASRNWKKEKIELKAEMKELSEKGKDTTALEERIQQIESYQRRKASVYSGLKIELKDVLNHFFGVNGMELDTLCNEYGYTSIAKVYDQRTLALEEVHDRLKNHEEELEEFFSFDINAFLTHANSWAPKRQLYGEAYKEDIGISGMEMDGTGGGKPTYNTSDPITKQVISREENKERYERYGFYLDVLQDALKNAFTSKNKSWAYNVEQKFVKRDLICTMYLPTGKDARIFKAARMRKLSEEYYISISALERNLRYAKQDMKGYIEKKYFGRVFGGEC